MEHRQEQQGYRRRFLHHDALTMGIAALILILINLVFFFSMDSNFINTQGEMLWLLMLRGGMVLSSGGVMTVCWHAVRGSCSVRRYDQVVLAWALINVVLFSLVVLTRPRILLPRLPGSICL